MWQYYCQLAICHVAVALFCHLANNLPMANRIREVRRSKDITLEGLADMTGISTSHLSRMEAGTRGVSLEQIIKIARSLGTEPEDLSDEFNQDDLERAKSMAVFPNEGAQKRGDIPNFTIHAGMGPGGALSVTTNDAGEVYSDFSDGFWSFPDAVKAGFRRMSKVFALPVIGDSMEPTLPNGSFVFIDTTHNVPSPPDVYALDYGDGLMIKRVEMLPGNEKVVVMSDNERYRQHELPQDDVRVYGRVVAWFQWRG
jgi:transcriptional regulator with XRE-family HTH domain